MVYQNSETYRRPGLLERRENVEVNLITSRKELSASRKNKSLQATARCEILFGLIREKKWEEVLQKLDYYESDAKQWIEEHNDDGTTRWKSLLIHLVRVTLIFAHVVPIESFSLQFNLIYESSST
jgi:phage gp46-like protein